MSFSSRCVVAGAAGPLNLSIPLEQGREQKRLVKDVKIVQDIRWKRSHWRTLQACYNKSPWFDQYSQEIGALYDKRYIFLLDWNLACFAWTMEKLGLPTLYIFTDGHTKPYSGAADDWRNRVKPKNYRTFEVIKYRQVFEERTGFLPNLSILDLLFCEGKNAARLLSNALP